MSNVVVTIDITFDVRQRYCQILYGFAIHLIHVKGDVKEEILDILSADKNTKGNHSRSYFSIVKSATKSVEDRILTHNKVITTQRVRGFYSRKPPDINIFKMIYLFVECMQNLHAKKICVKQIDFNMNS